MIDKGWTNLVFDINDSWIFRFARFEGSHQIDVEKAFLPIFSTISPISVPKPIVRMDSAKDNFIAYSKIQGFSFSQERFNSFNQKDLTAVCQSLGLFLSTLHKFEFQHEYLLDYPYGGASFWDELWPQVSPLLNTKSRDKTLNFFSETIDLFERNPVKKTITHSDLGPNNLLLDASVNRLSGVLDFGDIAVADPAIDFSSFYRNFGRHFVETILNHYSPELGDNFWLRVDYQSKRKLFFVTYFALNFGYEESVPGLVKVIETMF